MDKKNDRPSRFDCVEVSKYNKMRNVCGWSGISCLFLSIVTLTLGIGIPFLVTEITFMTVWTGLGLEALSFCLFYLYQWIAKNAT